MLPVLSIKEIHYPRTERIIILIDYVGVSSMISIEFNGINI